MGDRLISEEGLEVRVEGITDTGRFEKVYNLRVAENHTYYVGSAVWCFDVWVHNTCAGIHHFWPVSMGSLLRKGTLYLDSMEHTLLHTELNQHLNSIVRNVEGIRVTMWARKGNPTKAVVDAFNPAERLNKLDQFYKHYADEKYYQYFIAERKATLARGAFR